MATIAVIKEKTWKEDFWQPEREVKCFALIIKREKMSVLRGKQDVLGLYSLIVMAGYQPQTQEHGSLTLQGLSSHIRRCLRLDTCGAGSPDEECRDRALSANLLASSHVLRWVLSCSHLTPREIIFESPVVGSVSEVLGSCSEVPDVETGVYMVGPKAQSDGIIGHTGQDSYRREKIEIFLCDLG